MKKNSAIFLLAFLALAVIFVTVSCASGPESGSSSTGTSGGAGKEYISFMLQLNDAGKIAAGGYYVILLNSSIESIEVTNAGTYTDVIRLSYDPGIGYVHYWYHRIASVPGPGYEFVATARVDEYGQVSSDGRSVTYTFKTNDSSVIFNQYMSSRFTCHAMTTDTYQNSILGRVIDTLGPGPDITHNDLYTIFVTKVIGPEKPLPADYPQDNLLDWVTQSDLSSDFNYQNFDIESFQVNCY
ncbi:MAG: hypothetical protein AB2L14_09395 [Candidatus Xenobiia bacterium LiM19]